MSHPQDLTPFECLVTSIIYLKDQEDCDAATYPEILEMWDAFCTTAHACKKRILEIPDHECPCSCCKHRIDTGGCKLKNDNSCKPTCDIQKIGCIDFEPSENPEERKKKWVQSTNEKFTEQNITDAFKVLGVLIADFKL